MNLEFLFSFLLLACLTRGQLDLRTHNNHDTAFLTWKILDISDNALNEDLARQIKPLTKNDQLRRNGQLEFKTQEQFFTNSNEQTDHGLASMNLYPSGLHIKWEIGPRIETLRKKSFVSPNKIRRTSWYQTGETIQQTPGTPSQSLVYPLKETSGHPEHITGNDIHQLLRLRRQTMNRSPMGEMAGPSAEQQSRRQQVLQRIFQSPTQEQTVSGEHNVRTATTEQFRRNITQHTMQTSRFLGQGTSQQQSVRIPQQMVRTQGQPSTDLFLTRGEHPLAWTNRQAGGTPTGQMPGTFGQMVGRPGQIIARIPAPLPVQTVGHQLLGSSTNGQQMQAFAPATSNQQPFSFQMARSPAQQIPQSFRRPLTRTSQQQIFRTPIHQIIRNPNGQTVGMHGQQFTGTLSQQARSLPNSMIMNQSPRSRAAGLPFALLGTRPISSIQQARFIASPALTGQGTMVAGTQTINDQSRSTSFNMMGRNSVRNGISALGPIFTVLPGQDFGGNSMMESSRGSSSLDQGRHLSSPFSSASSMGSEMGMDIQNNFAMDSSSTRPEFLQFLPRSRVNMPMFDVALDGQSFIPQRRPQIWSGEPTMSMIPSEGFGPVPGVPLEFGRERPFLQPMFDTSMEGFSSILGESQRFTPW